MLEEPNSCGCTVRHMITLHNLQYSHCLMTGSATVCCCIDCINCTAVDGWKKCTGVMAVATEMVLQWHCLLNNAVCNIAIDCCSTQCGPKILGLIYFKKSKTHEEDTIFFFKFKISSIGIHTGFCTVVHFLKNCRKSLFLDLL